jgi:ribA/ribD-fused uncharacterized protein
MTKPVFGFFDEFEFLSNFYPSKVNIYGIEYPTVEHAFQALKTFNLDQRFEILVAETPGQAKRLGQKVDLRADWEAIKIDVMYSCCWTKFSSSVKLSGLLQNTGRSYLE